MSARRGLRPRLGCALGAGLRSLGRPPVVADTVVADTVVARSRHHGQRRCGEGCTCRGGRAGAAGAVCAGFGRQGPCGASAGAGWLRRYCWCLVRYCLRLRRGSVVFLVDLNDLDDDPIGLLLSVLAVFSCALLPALGALSVLYPRIQFSRLLRRPSDPHTATVMASKGGGRTLIFDIPWDGTVAGTSRCPRFTSRCGRRPACWCPVRG